MSEANKAYLKILWHCFLWKFIFRSSHEPGHIPSLGLAGLKLMVCADTKNNTFLDHVKLFQNFSPRNFFRARTNFRGKERGREIAKARDI